MKLRRINLRGIIISAAIILLLGAIFFQRIGAQQDTLNLLINISPDVVSYESIRGKYPSYKLYDLNKSLLGYGVISKASGYGGPITVLTGVNPKGQIIKIKIIDNYESPYYYQRLIDYGYLDKFIDKHISEKLEVGKGLDAISGATVTAEGISIAVCKATNQIGVQEFEMQDQNFNKIEIGISETILILLFALIIFSKSEKINKLRIYILIFSVFFLGFKLNAPINIGNFASLISGNAPSFFERPFWYFLIIGTILLLLITGKNYYCTWLCPFGAVQEGINKSLGLIKIPVPRKFSINAKKIRLTLTWIALMVGFLFVNPSISSYEPFSAFFAGQANIGQWLIMGITLLLSIFLYKFWCRFFCPAGAILDLVASTKRNIKKINLNLTETQKDNSCNSCPHSKPCKNKTSRVSEGELKYNKFFEIVISSYILLIIFTLIMNIGII